MTARCRQIKCPDAQGVLYNAGQLCVDYCNAGYSGFEMNFEV